MRSHFMAALFGLLLLVYVNGALAFVHVVKEGDTLAAIAERYYGRIQLEQVLVAANGLDKTGGSPIQTGMRLEIPALEHRRVLAEETWAGLALDTLGSAHRAVVLAEANGTYPWLSPEEGALIQVPYNLALFVEPTDTIVAIAQKYLGRRERAWMLDNYNRLGGRKFRRGDVILVPLVDLGLSADGKRAAGDATRNVASQGEAESRDLQLQVTAELPALIADVRGGRYVDALARGTRFLATGDLSKPSLAVVHRQLLEAYVALGAAGRATAACDAWRENDRGATLDAVQLSPKIIAACQRGGETK
jgi:phage tail protein X